MQGAKRRAVIGDSRCITVDSAVESADFADIRHVPLPDFDAVFLCTPDVVKHDIVRYLVSNGKHVLVEKPFSLRQEEYDDLTTRGRIEIAIAMQARCFIPPDSSCGNRSAVSGGRPTPRISSRTRVSNPSPRGASP